MSKSSVRIPFWNYGIMEFWSLGTRFCVAVRIMWGRKDNVKCVWMQCRIKECKKYFFGALVLKDRAWAFCTVGRNHSHKECKREIPTGF